MPDDAAYGSLPFAEQIAFFKSKLNLPTEHWDDLLGAAHDRAFVVAGVTSADLLADLHAAVLKGIEQGTTLAEFRRDFDALVERNGWVGWTGDGTAEGRAWRTEVIYSTNLRTSYAAGRWAQIQDVQATRPYLLYRHADGVLSPRPEHLAWDGLVLPVDDPFWQTHYPPNDWGCKCRVFAVSDQDLEKLGKAGPDRAPVPPGDTRGIGRGWDYAPGASLQHLRATVERKAAALPGPLGRDLLADIRTFEEHATAKAAGKWAVDANLVDFADYTGVKPEVANAWNRSLFEHLTDFPALRARQKFAGSAQAQFSRWRALEVARILDGLRAANPGVDDGALRAYAERKVKAKKVAGNTYAHSWDQPSVSGIAVNAKWGKDPAALKATLANDVKTGWHPPGTQTIKAVVDHELGHQLDTLLEIANEPEIQALWAQGPAVVRADVSGYAGKNIKEMIAEGWAEYRNSAAPRPMAKKIGETIERRYRDRYPAGA